MSLCTTVILDYCSVLNLISWFAFRWRNRGFSVQLFAFVYGIIVVSGCNQDRTARAYYHRAVLFQILYAVVVKLLDAMPELELLGRLNSSRPLVCIDVANAVSFFLMKHAIRIYLWGALLFYFRPCT